MPNHRSSLPKRMDQTMALGSFRLILLNAAQGFDETTDLAQILQYECIQGTGGYQSQLFDYTPGSSYFDADRGYQRTPEVQIQFTEANGGPGYSFTHIAFWQGRGSNSNRLITSVDPTNDRITCLAHGLIDGSKAFVRSTAMRPGGLAVQSYFMKVIDVDTLEPYTDAALTQKVNITSAGSGTLHLQYTDGVLFTYDSINGLIEPLSPKTFEFFYELQ